MPKIDIIVYIMDSARYRDFMDIYSILKYPLKKDFLIFPNAYSFGTWTKPASSSILFGLPARVTHMKEYNDAIPCELANIYKPLRDCGYTVNLITTNVITSSAFGNDKYFDFFCDTFDTKRGASLHLGLSESILNALRAYAPDSLLHLAPSDVLHREYLDKISIDHNHHITFIWSMDTHHPYYDLSKAGGTNEDETLEIVTHKDILEGDSHKLEKAHELHRKSIEYNLNTFFALLEAIDAQKYKNTLIFLISDHGDAFGERWHITNLRKLSKKRIVSHDTYPVQEVIRIPFLVKFPQGWDIKCGNQQVVTTNTILPTIFDMLGIKPQISLFENSVLAPSSMQKWKVVSEHWRGNSSYLVLVDYHNNYQFTEIINENQEKASTIMGRLKNHIKNYIKSKYGILGMKIIGNPRAPRPKIEIIERVKKNYLQLCGKFAFKHSKVSIKDDKEVIDRLRSLGYV